MNIVAAAAVVDADCFPVVVVVILQTRSLEASVSQPAGCSKAPEMANRILRLGRRRFLLISLSVPYFAPFCYSFHLIPKRAVR